MYTEDDLLPISALQHLLFCERRAALVHIEGLWGENVFTTEGTLLHDRADEPGTEVRGDMRIARGLRLRSLRLGLAGIADVVEFHKVENGIPLEGIGGLWYPTIVEYKRGKLRKEDGYEIQLCAQALCLEEMLGAKILSGEIYYGKTKRRLDIVFNEKLRRETEAAAAHLHDLLEGNVTPRAVWGPKCEKCSLVDLCLPKATGGKGSVEDYLKKVVTNPPQSPFD